MRLRSVIILTAVLGVGIAFWILMPVESADRPPPVVRFVQSIGRGADRIAVFAVTNTASRKPIWMGDVQIQVSDISGWRTITEQEFRVSPFVDEHGAANIHFPQLLEPGAHRMFIVDWPAAQSWRANVEYHKVLEGFAALESKARIAWATRTLSYWTGLVHVAVGHVASDEVQDLSRTNHSSQPPPATPP